MIIADVFVNSSSATTEIHDLLPRGASGLKVRFHFADSEWNYLSKTAVFRNRNTTIDAVIINNSVKTILDTELKEIDIELKEIYSFNRKVFMSETNSVINKEDSFRINNFFTKYLRYNYLLGDTDVVKDIPEVKTILFNNSWLKQYNRNNFFAIKDGIVTMEHRYGNNLLTLELEEEIVNILKVNNIPLNDYIVQSAFREYFKCFECI